MWSDNQSKKPLFSIRIRFGSGFSWVTGSPDIKSKANIGARKGEDVIILCYISHNLIDPNPNSSNLNYSTGKFLPISSSSSFMSSSPSEVLIMLWVDTFFITLYVWEKSIFLIKIYITIWHSQLILDSELFSSLLALRPSAQANFKTLSWFFITDVLYCIVWRWDTCIYGELFSSSMQSEVINIENLPVHKIVLLIILYSTLYLRETFACNCIAKSLTSISQIIPASHW